jgi:glycosyltransferase involved in cell wall biosynthesis
VSSRVSFVVPVHNGAAWLGEVLAAILLAGRGREIEVLVVDDGSTDLSLEVARSFAGSGPVRVLEGPGRGAAAAINLGVREATGSVVCQVDQDVVIGEGWLAALLGALEDPSVAAAQGTYVCDRGASPWARVAAYDLALRWSGLAEKGTDHVCSGNTAYRVAPLVAVGLLDESLGYGYDNDLSYRLGQAGLGLALCPAARAVHRFKEGLLAYLAQQYGLGYGRLDLIARHPRRVTGDRVSGLGMILHVPVTLLAVGTAVAAAVLAASGARWVPAAVVAITLLALQVAERAVAACRALWLSRDVAALLMVPAHLLRNLVWVAATLVWVSRRLSGQRSRPTHSMPRS